MVNNLVINSQQAMPGGGIITIEATNLVITRSTVEHSVFLQPGRYIRISVRDRGVGIAPEFIDKVFDPYFTTKQKGSGLGLATSYSIVKNHDGNITLTSELGSGTTFHVYLKASRHHIRHAERDVRNDPAAVIKAKVLHMDDEEMILHTTRKMLESLGCEVVSARNGDDAIEKYIHARDAGTPFDIVFLDITIPGGLGGKETMKRLLAIDPGIRGIVSSGYSNDPVMARFRRYGFKGVIAKPYLIEELDEVMRQVLGGNRRFLGFFPANTYTAERPSRGHLFSQMPHPLQRSSTI